MQMWPHVIRQDGLTGSRYIDYVVTLTASEVRRRIPNWRHDTADDRGLAIQIHVATGRLVEVRHANSGRRRRVTPSELERYRAFIRAARTFAHGRGKRYDGVPPATDEYVSVLGSRSGVRRVKQG